MSTEEATAGETLRRSSRWDPFVVELRGFRDRVGRPSFQVLADRVAAARVARGVDPRAARVGKTTVYDCFQPGRPRYNVDLAAEVAAALGATPSQVEAWREACDSAAPPSPVAPEAPVAPVARVAAVRVLLLCLAISLLGRSIVVFLGLPLHLDMTGTAIAAFVLGPWQAVLVGIATNLAGVGVSGTVSIPFALVQVAGGLAWGYGIRRGRAAERLAPFVGLAVVVALVCSVVAVPIVLAITPWETRPAFAAADEAFLALWGSRVFATFMGNLATSLLDKTFSAFIALAVVASLGPALRARLPLANRLSGRD